MKKLALILLAALLAVFLIACSSDDGADVSANDYAADATTSKLDNGTITFEVYTGDSIRITNYVGIYTLHDETIPEVVIPQGTNTELTVEIIGKEAFYYCTALKSITLPNTITSIEDWAFAGCTGLESITIPASVNSIGKGAFNGCTSLKSITFADGSAIESIGDFAFNDCFALETINLPEGLKSIGNSSFRDCEALAAVKTPASLESIGDMAFYGCTALNAPGALDLSASVNIEVSTVTVEDKEVEVIAIGDFAFASINKLYITVPADENSAVAKYVAAMRDFEETETPDSDESGSEAATEETGTSAAE